ncbi:MAG: 2-amino-4-hydroxy-6-hydroxymethyldihydropteridine diphosphokinase [Bacteroidales bacterium]
MIRLVISIGSNKVDGEARVQAAIEWLRGLLSDCHVSHIYTTTACNGVGVDYFNAVLSGNYDGELIVIAPLIKRYEVKAGRIADDSKSVAIDIDVVISDDVVLREWDYNQRYFKIGYAVINNK